MGDKKTTKNGNEYRVLVVRDDVKIWFKIGAYESRLVIPCHAADPDIYGQLVDSIVGMHEDEAEGRRAATDLECSVASNTRSIGDVKDEMSELRQRMEYFSGLCVALESKVSQIGIELLQAYASKGKGET